MSGRFTRASDSSLFQDVVFGVQHDAFESPLARCLLRNYVLGVRDAQTDPMIRDVVRPLKTLEAFGELPPFRLPQAPGGEITLGWDLANRPIRFPLRWVNAGVLNLGNTGAGKSNLFKHLVVQIVPRVQGLWCADFYKTEMRHLRPVLQRQGRELIVLRRPRMQLNPLQADGVDPRVHLTVAVDILCRVLGLSSRAGAHVRDAVHGLYEEFGVYNGRQDAWPNLFDVYERVRAASGLNPQAKDSILDRLGSLLLGLSPEVCGYRQAWRPSDLSKRLVVFEFQGASEAEKSLLVNHLLFSELNRRVAQGPANAPLGFCCVFEDAQRFCGARTEDGAITPLEELAGLIRGTGTALIFGAQTLAGFPRGLSANLATKIMGRLGSHADWQALGADMGMSPEQIQWGALHLRPGLHIGQFAEGPWRRPFVFRVPKMNVPSMVSDEEADASVEALRDLRVVPAPEHAHWRPERTIRLSSGAYGGAAVRPGLGEPELRYLRAVAAQPGQSSSLYARLAGVSGKRAAEIRGRLVAEGYVREHKAATGQRGRSAIVLEPLEPAFEAVNTNG